MMLMHSVCVETVITANTRYNELVLNVAPLLTKKKKHSDKDHMAKSPAKWSHLLK